MKETSKDLLKLEHKDPSSSSLESSLLVCERKKEKSDVKPTTSSVPQSQVLGDVKDFLGVISEANRRLQLDAEANSGKNFDIEVLTGNESQVIEMDLMLGVADLHTPEAVAAAEAAIAGSQPVIQLPDSSTETDSDSSTETDDKSDDGDTSKSVRDGTRKSKKRPKILELF